MGCHKNHLTPWPTQHSSVKDAGEQRDPEPRVGTCYGCTAPWSSWWGVRERGNDMVPWVGESPWLCGLAEGCSVSWVREQTLFRWREGPGRRAPRRLSGSASCTGRGDGIPPVVQVGHSQVPLIWCCILSLLSFQGHFPFNWDHGVIYASYTRLESTIRSKVPI